MFVLRRVPPGLTLHTQVLGFEFAHLEEGYYTDAEDALLMMLSLDPPPACIAGAAAGAAAGAVGDRTPEAATAGGRGATNSDRLRP